jgi:hypothetical protein
LYIIILRDGKLKIKKEESFCTLKIRDSPEKEFGTEFWNLEGYFEPCRVKSE